MVEWGTAWFRQGGGRSCESMFMQAEDSRRQGSSSSRQRV